MEAETFDGFTQEECVRLRQYLIRIRQNLMRAAGKECGS